MVGTEAPENSDSSSGGSSSGSGSSHSEQSEWTSERKDFNVFGVNEWIRAISFWHLLSDLPTAWSFLRVRKGHIHDADSFKWLARWYSGIVGWVASLLNLYTAGMFIYYGFQNKDNEYARDLENEGYTYCASTDTYYLSWRAYEKYCNDETLQTEVKEEITYSIVSAWNIVATFIIVHEIVTWFIYYIYKPGALKYANMLDEERIYY